jgi:hypothetical protein
LIHPRAKFHASLRHLLPPGDRLTRQDHRADRARSRGLSRHPLDPARRRRPLGLRQLDSLGHRLFIAGETRVTVVDPVSGKLLAEIPGLDGAHGIALASSAGRGFATSGHDGSVTMFDLRSLRVLARVPAAANAVAVLYDPSSGRAFTFNGDPGTSTVGAGFHLGERTAVRVAGAIASGAPTTPVTTTGVWDAAGVFDVGQEIVGTPEAVGPVKLARLPTYWQVDAGLVHDWRIQALGRPGTLATFTNLLGVRNPLAYTVNRAGARRALDFPSRALDLRLSWRF